MLRRTRGGRVCHAAGNGDARHDGAGLDGDHSAPAIPGALSAEGRYGLGNSLEKIANTGHNTHDRRRHAANFGSIHLTVRAREMRGAALIVFVSITSPSLADDLTEKGLVSDPTGNVHNLSDLQCWRVLDNYKLMSETGRVRIEGIATQCRAQVSGKSKPTESMVPSGDRALQPMQAATPMVGGPNMIAPRRPAQ